MPREDLSQRAKRIVGIATGEVAPAYPKGDLRRMLAVLGAIQQTKGATLLQIAARTGLDKKTVTDLIAAARQQAAVRIEKVGSRYLLADLGPVFKKAGVNLALTGALNAL